MISRDVREKLRHDQRLVLARLRELRTALEAGDRVELANRAGTLEHVLGAHLSLVEYVIEAIADDDCDVE